MRTMRLTTAAAAALALMIAPAAAQARDRDHDGLPDKWEKHFHLSTRANSDNGDPDHDHVDNRNEFREGTNPRRRDSDHDGLPDGREDRDHDKLNNAAEDATGNDPRNPDTDGDGVRDGAEDAGVVTEVKGPMVTIDIANGGSITARVDGDTDQTCATEGEVEQDQGSAAARASSEGRPEHGGDGPPPPSGDQPAGGDQGDSPGADDGADDPGAGDDGSDNGDDTADDPASDGPDQTDPGFDPCPRGAVHRGAKVHEAELDLGPGGAVWSSIELLRR